MTAGVYASRIRRRSARHCSLGAIAACLALGTISPLAPATIAAAQADSGVLDGTVTEAASGRALSGAIVTIAETGTTQRTDATGRYRFAALPDGTYTIEVSFIGLERAAQTVQVVAGTPSRTDFQLEPSAEIVVTGARGAQAAALNEQRSLDNSATVVSSDLTGRFPDNTAAEAMRRLPGVSFERQEGSGEGQFISIRGLDSGLNNVKINGVNSAEANAGNRRVPIDAFQSDSISKIVVNKTLLPNHEGVGLGGAVELSTSTAFELRRPLRQLSAEGTHNDFSGREGYRIAGTVSQIFGADEQFGILLSAAYRKRYTTSYQLQIDTSPRPIELPALTSRNGAIYSGTGTPFFPTSDGDLPSNFVFDLSAPELFRLRTLRTQRFDIDRDNLSLTGALDWRLSDTTTIALIGSFNETKFDRSESRTEYRMGNRFITRLGNASGAPFISPFDANGDGVAEGGLANWVPSNPEIRTRGAIQDFKSTNNTFVVRGETEVDRWTFNYQAGYAQANTRSATSEVEFAAQRLQNSATPIIEVDGRSGVRFFNINFLDNPAAPYIDNLTPAGQAALTDPSFFRFLSNDSEFTETRDRRWSGRFDAAYEVGGWLETITVGGKFETSKRTQTFLEFMDTNLVDPDGTVRPGAAGTFTLADTDLLTGGTFSFAPLNIAEYANYEILRFDPARVAAFIDRGLGSVDAARAANPAGAFGGQLSDELIEEDVFAGYAMGKAAWGDWSLIAGARVEHGRINTLVDQSIDIEADAGSSLPDISTTIAGTPVGSTYTEVLPRFQLNYRPDENLVFRGAFYTAIARPEYQFLSAAQSISRDAGDDFSVDLGNPDLDNAYGYNFDLGVELYQGSVGFIGVNLFYKHIKNFIFDNSDGVFDGGVAGLQAALDAQGIDIDLAAYGATDGNIDVSQPQNGRTADVYGVEFSVVRQFNQLPGALGGLGFYGNLTLQRSSASIDVKTDALTGEIIQLDVPFFNAPNYVGTAALTYTKYGIDATLSYSFQDKSNAEIASTGLYEVYDRPYESLDLTVNYTFDVGASSELTLFVAVTDLLDNGSSPINYESFGSSGLVPRIVEYDGRSFRAGARVKF